jgi:hypothetical protein
MILTLFIKLLLELVFICSYCMSEITFLQHHLRKLFIVLIMEAKSTSETSINLYQATRCRNLKDSHLQVLYSIGQV